MTAIDLHMYQLEGPEGTRWHNVVPTTVLWAFKKWGRPQDIAHNNEEIYKVNEIVIWEE